MITNRLKLAFVSASMLASAAVFAGEPVKEVKAGVRPGKVLMKKPASAPGHASYETTLTGFVYYAESWNDLETTTPMGVYTIGVTPGAQPQEFGVIGKASSHCNGGAVLAGDTYWYIWRQTDPTGQSDVDISQLYSFNVVTGETAAYGVVSSELASTSDKTWDPVTKKIYGQYEIDGARKLCIVDYEQQTVTPVGNCGTYYGLACDAAGQLYGIDNGGILYKVDKNNGAATKIGATGVTPKYSQSMTFDFKTGDLYWASYTDAGKASSVLYKVDTATAKTTLITVFSDKEEIMGLGVMPAAYADGAPGYPTNLKVEADKASTTATISFTVPEYTFMGNPLTGEVSWKLFANGNELKSGKAQAGATVSETLILPVGSVKVSAVCSNAEGDGPAAVITRWIGDGYPLAPTGVKFEINEKTGKVDLTWNPVTAGEDNGYVDPAKVTYKVIAYPGKREAAKGLTATSFTETIEQPQTPVDCWYEVYACNDWRESEPGVSNHHPYGRGFEVPYDNSFDTPESLDLFYTIDGNNDGYTWEWSQYNGKTAYIFTGTDNVKPQDDWLITPGIDMKAGNRYQLTYKTSKNLGGNRFFDHLEVAFGLGVDPSKYEVVQETFRYDPNEERRYDIIVYPKEDGYYHFGFHAVSDAIKGLAMNLDDFHVDVLANENAPAAVKNLTVKTSQGTAPVTLTFTTPTETAAGGKLDAITKVELWRNQSTLVASKEETKTGKKMSLVDNKGAKGLTTYTVVAYNEHGVGVRSEISVYLGIDIPGRPLDIVLSDNGKGGVKLTWKAPEKGANGGYIDAGNLVYNVYEVSNGYAVEYKNGIVGTEFEVAQHPSYYNKDQELLTYGVSAQSSVGESPIASSTEIILGTPYTYPFVESWVKGEAQYSMWYRMNSGADGWLPTVDKAADNDGGSMRFIPAADGDMSYFCLGKVSMANAKEPKLIFSYYAYPGQDIIIMPEVNKGFRDGWQQMAPIRFADLDGEEGWREYGVDLKDFMAYPYISVRVLGASDARHPLYVDNLRIKDDKFEGVEGIGIDGVACEEYYDLNGFRVANPQKGAIYVVRDSEGKTRKIVY